MTIKEYVKQELEKLAAAYEAELVTQHEYDVALDYLKSLENKQGDASCWD